ncbi:hypothetical protein SNEBB_010220, partial [Seison nebaliae]
NYVRSSGGTFLLVCEWDKMKIRLVESRPEYVYYTNSATASCKEKKNASRFFQIEEKCITTDYGTKFAEFHIEHSTHPELPSHHSFLSCNKSGLMNKPYVDNFIPGLKILPRKIEIGLEVSPTEPNGEILIEKDNKYTLKIRILSNIEDICNAVDCKVECYVNEGSKKILTLIDKDYKSEEKFIDNTHVIYFIGWEKRTSDVKIVCDAHVLLEDENLTTQKIVEIKSG